jgi:V8-like Glu-specific endopeptidase
VLTQNFDLFLNLQARVSGYVRFPNTNKYVLINHFERFLKVKHGAAFYNIDTARGQGGAPVYLIFDNKVLLIGIHKGYSR